MIKLTVLRADNNDEESNLPSKYFPSAGLGHGWFELETTTGGLPSPGELSWALERWDDDCVLVEYDSATGRGQFVIVDWYAPAAGTVIDLKGPGDYGGEPVFPALGIDSSNCPSSARPHPSPRYPLLLRGSALRG